MYHM